MLKHLKLRNFRAFKSADFQFSAINVFVGPNNSGKSSAISAVNLLAQTITDNPSGTPLLLRGKYDDLGTFIDLVHGNIPRTRVSIEFSFEPFIYKIEFKYRSQRREIEITKYEIFSEDKPFFQYYGMGDGYKIRYFGRLFEHLFKSTTKRRPTIRGLTLIDPNIRNFRMGVRQADLFDRKKDQKDIYKMDQLMWRANRRLTVLFQKYDSLSPFRELPQRTFLFSGETSPQVGRTGDKAVNILVSDNFARGRAKRGLVDSVSSFFRDTGMAEQVEIKALTSRHFEVCLRGNDGRLHNICDVGFGCSQVLPVLVGGLNLFYSGDGVGPHVAPPIYVVQEPEIHLHPNAQADLGSFFVNLAKRRGQIFLETHSDNLVLRIQRHVALGNIEADKVKVFWMEDIDGDKRVTSLSLNDEGVFQQNWPGGFFPQRQTESFELARASSTHRKPRKKKA